jgi:hypothetical protein
MVENKIRTLKQKFSEGDKLDLLENIRIKLLQSATDCDGMCGPCNVWYCETYKNLHTIKQDYKAN